MVNKDYNEEHKLTRKKLWIDVFVAYTGSSNSTSKNGGATWADFALKEFDERFKSKDINITEAFKNCKKSNE